MDQKTKANIVFSDYLYIIYKWRKFLIINIVLVTALATLYAFLLPKEYKATATIMIPPDNSMSGLGGLTSLIGGKSSIASLGSKAFGISGTSEDLVLGILNSRVAQINVIEKFHLMEYYDIKDNNVDKVLKAFKDDLMADPNEFGMIEISVVNENPEKSAEIANYFVELLDSLNIEINVEQARNNRLFIEKRYLKNISDMKNAEDSMYIFQKKYGIFAVPEQLEVAVKAAGELETQLTSKEMEQYFLKQLYGENSPQALGLKAQIDMLRNKVTELKKADKLSSISNVLFPFKDAPDMTIQYLRHYREVEIQSKILELVLPLYEQAKVEEQKSIPTIAVLDKAASPQIKYRPQKAFIILAFVFVGFFIMLPLVYRMEAIANRETFKNPIEEKEFKKYRSIKKLYRII